MALNSILEILAVVSMPTVYGLLHSYETDALFVLLILDLNLTLQKENLCYVLGKHL